MSTQTFDFIETECLECKSKFPNIDKRYTIAPILDANIVRGNFNFPPKLIDYNIIFADVNEVKIEGNFYQIKANLERATWKVNQYFCSNECAYDYSIKNQVLIMFKNNIMNGFVVAISQFTKVINEELKNIYKFRPQKWLT